MPDSKIFMFPNEGNNDAALWATLSNNNRCNDAAAMMGGGNMWNNPIWAIVFLAALLNGGIFGGGNGRYGALNIEIQDLLSSIREQLNNNQNTSLLMDAVKGNGQAVGQLANAINCDFNAVQAAINSVQAAICNVGSKVDMNAMQTINAINSGNSALATQLSECCCTVRDAITRQGYENQLATVNQTNLLQSSINSVATGQERGFSSIAYETQRQTCDITKAIADSTAAILAGQKAAEMREMLREIQTLRDEKSVYQLSAISQELTRNIVNQIRPCPVPAYITCNPFGCQGDQAYYGNCGNCS